MNSIDDILCRAVDLLVDDQTTAAEDLLEEAISILREQLPELTAPEEIARCQESWGDALALMEEPELALLRYEAGLAAVPQDQALLWKICRTMLDDLERYDEAERLLTEQLLPLDPENSNYLDALDLAKGPSRFRDLESELENSDEHRIDAEEGDDALDHADFHSGFGDPTDDEESEKESDDD